MLAAKRAEARPEKKTAGLVVQPGRLVLLEWTTG